MAIRTASTSGSIRNTGTVITTFRVKLNVRVYGALGELVSDRSSSNPMASVPALLDVGQSTPVFAMSGQFVVPDGGYAEGWVSLVAENPPVAADLSRAPTTRFTEPAPAPPPPEPVVSGELVGFGTTIARLGEQEENEELFAIRQRLM